MTRVPSTWTPSSSWCQRFGLGIRPSWLSPAGRQSLFWATLWFGSKILCVSCKIINKNEHLVAVGSQCSRLQYFERWPGESARSIAVKRFCSVWTVNPSKADGVSMTVSAEMAVLDHLSQTSAAITYHSAVLRLPGARSKAVVAGPHHPK